MPLLLRYFLYVGGVLLALLFTVESNLPRLPVAEKAEAHLPSIRIYSDERWPARVVFDTSVRTITPSQPTSAELNISASAMVAGAPPKMREAFAQLQPSYPNKLQSNEPKKPQAKPERERKTTKKRAPPPAFLVARQSPFGWYGSRYWR